MAPYRYADYHNPYIPSVAELLERHGEIAAAGAQQIGAANARAAELNGQAWAQAARNIGGTVAAIPGQIQEQQHAQTINDLNTLRLNEGKQAQAGGAAVDAMMRGDQLPAGDAGPRQQSFLDASGLFDIPKMTQSLGASGMGHLAPELLKGAESINDSILKHQQTEAALAKDHAILIGDLADGALKLHTTTGMPLDGAMDFVVQPALATKRISADDYAKVKAQIGQLPPEQQVAALGQLMDQAAKLAPNKTVAKDAQEYDRYGRLIASNAVPEKPTEASLAADAANPKSPTAPQSKTALDLLNAAKTHPTFELKPGRVDGQLVPAMLDPRTGRLSYNGEDVTERWQPLRDPVEAQAAAIAAQVAQQARAQAFAEAQAGRKELTDKVEQPYRQAQTSAQELRDLVHAAQAGNKEAASLQALQATMSTIRANGLNRLNAAEMKLPANAGSLWDRIQSKVGTLVSGQPIDASLQKDLLEYADLMEKGAYNKYASGHKDITTRYGLKDEKPLPMPTPQAAAPKTDPLNLFGGKP